MNRGVYIITAVIHGKAS